MPSKFAFFSVDAQAYPLAFHLEQEGHEVYVGQVQDWQAVHVKTTESSETRRKRLQLYQGMFKHKMPISSLMSFLLGQPRNRRDEWLIICDFNWMWQQADKLRAAGYRGLLPTKEDYDLEHDRMQARELITKLYPMVEVGEYHEFKKTADAIKFLKSDDDTLYCLKGFNADAETIVPDSDDPEINRQLLIDRLERKAENYEKDGFILEELIEDAIEFTPEAIGYNGKLVSVNIDIEHKRLGARNGPQTGCTLDLVLQQELDSEIYEWFLEPMADRMLRKNEITYWDLSILYSPSRKKFFAGEFCSNRFGYNAVFTEAGMFESTTDWIEAVTGEYDPPAAVGASLRMFNVKQKEALLIGDLGEHGIWPFDVYRDKTGKHLTTGVDTNAYVVTGSGESVESAIDDLYQREHRIEFDPGLCLQMRDWHDEQWKINILHRKKILEGIGLITTRAPLSHALPTALSERT